MACRNQWVEAPPNDAPAAATLSCWMSRLSVGVTIGGGHVSSRTAPVAERMRANGKYSHAPVPAPVTFRRPAACPASISSGGSTHDLRAGVVRTSRSLLRLGGPLEFGIVHLHHCGGASAGRY
jgi:hypothetical protein